MNVPSPPTVHRIARWSAVTIALVIVISAAWVSGVGAGAADDQLEATGTLDLGDAEYNASNETVRIVVARAADEPTRYETIPFEQFIQYRCYEIATHRVQRLLDTRYSESTDVPGSGYGDDGVHVWARLDPPVHPSYVDLLHTFPESVAVTLHYEKGTATCTVPIHIEGTRGTPQQSTGAPAR